MGRDPPSPHHSPATVTSCDCAHWSASLGATETLQVPGSPAGHVGGVQGTAVAFTPSTYDKETQMTPTNDLSRARRK